MVTPRRRGDFEKHVSILAEAIESGNFNPGPFIKGLRSLLNVKKCPNRRANFLTIDESARLMANSLASFQSHQFRPNLPENQQEEE